MEKAEKEEMMLQAADETLREFVSPEPYYIGARSDGRTCLLNDGPDWVILFCERGQDWDSKNLFGAGQSMPAAHKSRRK